MPEVALRTITEANWREAIVLEVDESQTGFVASNLFSVAQAAYEPNTYAVGVYDRATAQMVGFCMYGYLKFGAYKLWYIARLMVDRHQQGKGYGRSALEAVIRRLRNRHDADGILITVVPENQRAKSLYAKLGFIDDGARWDDETVMLLRGG